MVDADEPPTEPAPDRAVRWVAVTRGAVVSLGLVVLLAWPDRSSATTARIIGVIIVVAAATTLITERTTQIGDSRRRRDHLARITLLTVVGAVLLGWPGPTIRVTGRVIGAGLVILGVSGVYRSTTQVPDEDRRWAASKGALTTVVGISALALPERVGIIVLVGLVIAWAAEAVISLIALLADEDAPAGSAWTVAATMTLRRMEHLEMDGAQRQSLIRSLFFEGAAFRDRLWRFAVLMVLSSAIAALGIISDSTAVVVGAMLIAPLMAPIMATAAALLMAWPARAIRSLSTVAGGVALSVAVAWLLTGLFPQASEAILSSSQVTSRVDPTIVDLLIALTAGAAGAYAMSRPDISDSLPGVAIAVALVPPLAVVGITLQLHAWDDALGALVLFLTNLVAIILAGGGVFLITGFTPAGRLRRRGEDVRRAFAVVAVIAVVISVPLGVTGRQLLADAVAYDEAEAAVRTWVAGADLALVELEIRGSQVGVTIAGADDPGDVDDLGRLMEGALDRNIELTLTVVPVREFTFESGS